MSNRAALMFCFLAGLALASPASRADYEVDCSGSYDETGNSVTGTCTDGDFSGQDEDGGQVEGSCQFDGSFDAQSQESGANASGSCDGE